MMIHGASKVTYKVIVVKKLDQISHRLLLE
jgi:hypothetical protein